ncbi:MAG: RluA family pseudouridine synthase [Alphaproteobacteria bacterium]|nr:RluA family pseudouridine synthase [Alphaproteobacteria bacterium]
MRLIDHLRAGGSSSREARALLDSGKVWLHGVPTRDGGREVDPAHVAVRPNAPRITVGRDVSIVWRDPRLAVVVKPAGMLAVPAPKRRETNVLAEVGRIAGAALPVHRLDEGTSGLMLVAFDAEAQEALKAQLEAHTVERRYLALAAGVLRRSPVTVDTTLVRDRGDGLRGSGAPGASGGKRAVTHLRTVEVLGRSSLVEATLETGRTHQVRIHCAEQGCPILGDALYGGRGVARAAPRVALHAYVLAFAHPGTGEALRFEIPLADDLEGLRRRLAEDAERPRR